MRQRDPAERRALASLHDRLPGPYLDWAERAGRIEAFTDTTGAREQAIEEWQRAAVVAGPSQAVMIARDNETRAALNEAARELSRALGLLGEEHAYGPVELAVGDRVICRHNDRRIDIDNGTRGTVRHLDPDRVAIDTDSGLVREIPAAYVSEHLEHAYALTGHGMQGGTVETAIVVASPRDLTAGWSYTALSRARGHTWLLIYDQELAAERGEYAPPERIAPASRRELLARVEGRMLERDDEELAIEQLPEPSRANDPAVEGSPALRYEPAQERAAARAEPAPSTSAARELGERIEQLRAQLEALPTHQLRRIEHFEERALTLSTQREQLAQELARLPEPRRRFGRERDPHAGERAYLTSALAGHDREAQAVTGRRAELERELGDPAEIRAERDGLERAISESTREHTRALDELAERELRAPGPWVRETFGERPDGTWAREQWEDDVRGIARYRAQYELTDTRDALGPRPEGDQRQHDWERAHEAIEQGELRLGLDVGVEYDVDFGIGF
jgi:hypothetical protein